MLQIEPTLRRAMMPFSFASIPEKGIHEAASLAQKYTNSFPKENGYILKIDIKKFYPSINQTIMKKIIRKLFRDKDLLIELDKIIDSFNNIDISCYHLDPELEKLYNKDGYGLPIGSYLSQYLANLYLTYFDH
jgi:retron-type reverse transcriptase